MTPAERKQATNGTRMIDAIREYWVKIHWRRPGSRLNGKGYSIIARSQEDAKQFAMFRFDRSHPAPNTVEEIEVKTDG